MEPWLHSWRRQHQQIQHIPNDSKEDKQRDDVAENKLLEGACRELKVIILFGTLTWINKQKLFL